MSNNPIDIIRRIELEINQRGKSLTDKLVWLQNSDLVQVNSIDEIFRVLNHIHQFKIQEREEYIELIKVYLQLFERFPLLMKLRKQYFLLWQEFLDTNGHNISSTAISDVVYILDHQVNYLQLYGDDFDQIRTLAIGLVYRVKTLNKSNESETADALQLDLSALKDFYQSRLSDQEAFDLATQHILDKT
ncbi:MAG: hypothetical protein JJ895_04930 [Balneolaceae bacterium]|nr:hypothetical protein [Balneolaceae bacterium]